MKASTQRAAVICFSGQDARFVAECVRRVQCCVDEVILVCSDHRYDGRPEDRALLRGAVSLLTKCTIVQMPYLKDIAASYGTHFWVNMMRWVGFRYVPAHIEYVFFLDADEYVDDVRMNEWLNTGVYRRYDAVAFEAYWYFREARFRAIPTEYAGTLAACRHVSVGKIFSRKDRRALHVGRCCQKVVGCDGEPMIHHLSWVRTKDEMLSKVLSWGHRQERNWVGLVEEEFKHPFKGKDFVHGYTFEEVEPLPVASDVRRLFYPEQMLVPMEVLSPEELRKICQKLPWWVKIKLKWGR